MMRSSGHDDNLLIVVVVVASFVAVVVVLAVVVVVVYLPALPNLVTLLLKHPCRTSDHTTDAINIA